MNVPHSDALVFFGATGDLAHKKIFPSLQAMIKRGHLNVPVIGGAKAGWNVDQLPRAGARRSRETRREWMPRPSKNSAVCCATLTATTRRGDLSVHPQGARLRAAAGALPRHPPALFELVVEQLAKADCSQGARVIVEKPFGHDLASAQELNQILLGTFDEKSIFRIDHYLGKRPVHSWSSSVRERAPGVVLEPQSGRECADHDGGNFGVQGRGAFYDQTGTIRDVVQNHLFQILV